MRKKIHSLLLAIIVAISLISPMNVSASQRSYCDSSGIIINLEFTNNTRSSILTYVAYDKPSYVTSFVDLHHLSNLHTGVNIMLELVAPATYFQDKYAHLDLDRGYILALFELSCLETSLCTSGLNLYSDLADIVSAIPHNAIVIHIQGAFLSWSTYTFILTNLSPFVAIVNMTSSGTRTNNSVYSNSSNGILTSHGREIFAGYTSQPQHPVMILNAVFTLMPALSVSPPNPAMHFFAIPNHFITPFAEGVAFE